MDHFTLPHFADHRVFAAEPRPRQVAEGLVTIASTGAYYVARGVRANLARMNRTMSKVCAICGKQPSFGNNRSHSMRATPRRWDPNVQKIHIVLDGKPTRAYVCAKCLKANKVQKAV